jgi:ABC-type transporter Mla subunit MlaD
MSDDELERIMNFIIERQETGADQLAQAESIITALANVQTQTSKQLTAHDDRIARFERSYVAIAELLEKHDNQLVVVTENLNRLTDVVADLSATVNRYITARGNNGSNGA